MAQVPNTKQYVQCKSFTDIHRFKPRNANQHCLFHLKKYKKNPRLKVRGQMESHDHMLRIMFTHVQINVHAYVNLYNVLIYVGVNMCDVVRVCMLWK